MAPAGLAVAATSFAVFRGLHCGLQLLPTPHFADAQDRWKWRNICASLVHSLLSGVGALLWISQYSHWVSDFTHGCPPTTEALIFLSIGYFLEDGVDLLWNQTLGQSWQLLCHHALAMICLGVAVQPGHCLSISVVPLLLEVNSVFLHFQSLLLLSGQTSTLVFRLTTWATMATLPLFRLLPLGWMSLQLWWQHHHFPLDYSLLWGFELFIITIMSIVLVFDLWVVSGQSAQAPPFSRKKKKRPKAIGVMIMPGFHTESMVSSSGRIRLSSWHPGRALGP